MACVLTGAFVLGQAPVSTEAAVHAGVREYTYSMMKSNAYRWYFAGIYTVSFQHRAGADSRICSAKDHGK